jgi:transposase
MWTGQHRKIYQRGERRYPGGMTDGEWARLEPLIPPAKPGGRPRETNMREAINAILYLLRTGCPWRYLPREGFPPRPAVYNIFRNFQRAGVRDAIWEQLHMDLREDMGREAGAPAAIIDSQSLKPAEKGAVLTARQATMPGRRSKGPRVTPLPIRKVYRCVLSFIRPASKIVMEPRSCPIKSATAFPGSNSYRFHIRVTWRYRGRSSWI